MSSKGWNAFPGWIAQGYQQRNMWIPINQQLEFSRELGFIAMIWCWRPQPWYKWTSTPSLPDSYPELQLPNVEKINRQFKGQSKYPKYIWWYIYIIYLSKSQIYQSNWDWTVWFPGLPWTGRSQQTLTILKNATFIMPSRRFSKHDYVILCLHVCCLNTSTIHFSNSLVWCLHVCCLNTSTIHFWIL
jgi:hypothetical protein